jgi:simple sugar transport system substrate-binding protein
MPVLQLYVYLVSDKLSGIADVDTGLKFLDQTSVKPYASTKTRYEGSSTAAGVTKS